MGPAYRKEIEELLGSGRGPDLLLLTHFHYDHAGGAPYLLRMFPRMKLAGSARLQKLLARSQVVNIVSTFNRKLLNQGPGLCDLITEDLQYGELKISWILTDGQRIDLGGGMTIDVMATPGHTPDSICVILEGEVLFTGDTLLPEITPHPTLATVYESNCRIFPEEYHNGNSLYGLINYIKSLRRIADFPPRPFSINLPAHRLFFNNQFNLIHNASDRAREIIRFHIDRCAEILENAAKKPATLEDIATRHFPPHLLNGVGKNLAIDEISAHVEVLEECGDIQRTGPDLDSFEPTGTRRYRDQLGAYLEPSKNP